MLFIHLKGFLLVVVVGGFQFMIYEPRFSNVQYG